MRKSILVCLGYVLLMGLLYPLIRYYSDVFSVETNNGVRFCTGGLAIFSYTLWRSDLRQQYKSIFKSRKLLLKVLCLGSFNSINMFCFVLGLSMTSAVAGSIFGIVAMPLAVLLAAIFFVDERSKALRVKFFIGSLIAIAGSVYFVLHSASGTGAASEMNTEFFIGSLLLSAAITLQALFNLIVKSIGNSLNSLVITTMTSAFTGPVFVIMGLSSGAIYELADKSWLDILGLMGAGLVGIGAGLMLVQVIQLLGIITYNILQLTIPVVTAIIGYFLLNETVNIYQVIGASVVIVGCVYAILIKDKPKSTVTQ